MSQPSDRPTATTPSAPGSQPDDPLASLYKMSRTAGLGSQDYVAVNPMAVASLLVGLASVLALLFGPVLLIIPLVSVILSIVGISQVRRSGGTQSGIGIAVLGFLVAMLFVAAVGGKELLHQRQIANEQDKIVNLLDQLGKNLRARNYDAAWDEFSPRFHERFKKEGFIDVWNRLQASPMIGKIKSVHWNGILDVGTDQDTPIARGQVLIELDGSDPLRRMFLFRKLDDGTWTVDDIDGVDFSPHVPPAAH